MLLVVGIILAIAFYLTLYGPHLLYLPMGIALALSLFWLRGRYRLLYGTAEFLAGTFTLLQSYPTGRGAYSGAFAEPFEPYNWHAVFLTTLAGVYIMVRGLDNISQRWDFNQYIRQTFWHISRRIRR